MTPIDESAEAVELLQRLVATPSVSRDEAAVATVLCEWLAARGVGAERVDGDNVVVRVRGAQPGPRLLLNSHLDTVPRKDGWTRDPWGAAIEGDRLYGLGSNDAKASVAAMAAATVALAREGLACGELVFAATVMEETGGGGLEHIRPSLGALDGALVGEPTSLQGALAQGGLLILEATAEGRTAHAARPAEGINAISIAARDIVAVESVALDREHPFLGRSTAAVTVVRAGDRHNVIPDRCEFTIDVRYTPSYAAAELVERFAAVMRSKLRVRSERLRPVETDADSAIARALRTASPAIQFFGSPTMSDWVYLRDVPAIKIGPGDSERSHTPDEWVALDHVRRAVTLYRDAARAFLTAPAQELTT